MAKPKLDGELRSLIQPFLQPPKPIGRDTRDGKPPEDRAVLTGILFL